MCVQYHICVQEGVCEYRKVCVCVYRKVCVCVQEGVCACTRCMYSKVVCVNRMLYVYRMCMGRYACV